MPDGITILIADSRRLPLTESYDTVLSLLPDAEKQRAERYLRQEDRVRCAVGAFLIRHSISQTAGCANSLSGVRIARTEYGKPYAEGCHDLYFSLSHSGSMIVYTQASQEIGIDVEEIHDTDISDFSGFLNGQERKRIAAADDPLTEFYRIWTVKESFAKKEGTGLSLFEKENADIDYDNGQVLFRRTKSAVKTILLDRHILSVCTDGDMPAVVPCLISPDEWEKMLSSALTQMRYRSSHGAH